MVAYNDPIEAFRRGNFGRNAPTAISYIDGIAIPRLIISIMFPLRI